MIPTPADTGLVLIFILACPVFFALVVLHLAFWIPVRFSARAVLDEKTAEFSTTVRWAIAGVRLTKQRGSSKTEILLLDHAFTLREPDRDDKPVPPQKTDSVPVKSVSDLMTSIQAAAGPAIRIGTALCRQTSFEEIRGEAALGLGDPAATGMLYGSFWASRFAFDAARIHVRMIPVFDRAVFRLDLTIRFRLNHPLTLLERVLRELLIMDRANSGLRGKRHEVPE